VPKHENFSTAFFALSEPIWVCDVGTAKKSNFFYRLTLISMVLGFLLHTECAVSKKKYLKLGQNKKLLVVAFEPICMATMSFSKIFIEELIFLALTSTYSVGVE
jgi:hypothetical protein